MGLADREEVLTLRAPRKDSSQCTFRPVQSASMGAAVRVVAADSVPELRDLGGRVFIKVDVEGYEHKVLRGMPCLLSRNEVRLLVEVTPGWLVETGASAEQLFSTLYSYGFEALLPVLYWSLLMRPVVHFEPLASPLPDQHDVLFIKNALPPYLGRP